MYRYWTDNGACYYGTTGSKYVNYEDLLVAVKEDANKSGIPYRYIQVLAVLLGGHHLTNLNWMPKL